MRTSATLVRETRAPTRAKVVAWAAAQRPEAAEEPRAVRLVEALAVESWLAVPAVQVADPLVAAGQAEARVAPQLAEVQAAARQAGRAAA